MLPLNARRRECFSGVFSCSNLVFVARVRVALLSRRWWRSSSFGRKGARTRTSSRSAERSTSSTRCRRAPQPSRKAGTDRQKRAGTLGGSRNASAGMRAAWRATRHATAVCVRERACASRPVPTCLHNCRVLEFLPKCRMCACSDGAGGEIGDSASESVGQVSRERLKKRSLSASGSRRQC
eukprot:6191328-Pleurochrysis_carterae.AAC.1